MKSRQPASVLRRSSRIRAARQKSDPAPIKTNAVTTTESISTPRELSPVPPQPEKSLDSLTSASQERNDEHRTSPTLEESFASQMSLDEPLSIPLAEPAIDSHTRYNPITYKRQRTMRMSSSPVASGRQFASPAPIPSSALSRSTPLSQPLPGSTPLSQTGPSSPPGSPEPNLAPRQPSLVPLSQPDLGSAPSLPIPLSQHSSFHVTQSSAPSCSPVPAHVSHRRKRRRRLPPLKNRLAKVARSRLRQSPAHVPAPQPEPTRPVEDSEHGEEELVRDEEQEAKPAPVNVTQRRLAAPENFTIPDLKDLLGYRSQARPPQTPAPRFVLPQNTIRAPRLTQGSKSPYAKRKTAAHTPRLKFVALEAHHVQATTRSGNPTARLPLTPQTSPVRKFVLPKKEEIEDPVQNFSNRPPQPSPCRVLVKGTPELEEPAPKLPSLTGVMSARLTPEPEVEAQPSRSLAPMSELYDNLMKLAKSAHQMGRPVFPESPSLKRKLQTTLTPQLTLEVTQPTKVARLQ